MVTLDPKKSQKQLYNLKSCKEYLILETIPDASIREALKTCEEICLYHVSYVTINKIYM